MGHGARRLTIAGTVSIMTLASLSLMAWTWFAGTSATADGAVASMGGGQVEIRGTEWAHMDHVHDGEGGFLMPDEMMPGAPSMDEVRLGVDVILTNTRSGVYEFSLFDEFRMSAGDGPPLPLVADTVGNLHRLGPGNALNARLYFDIVVADTGTLPPLYLEWTRGRETLLIPVPLPGEAPGHQH
jgi:hypothetical protein